MRTAAKVLTVVFSLVCLSTLWSCAAFAQDLDFKQVYVDLQYGGNGRPGWVHAGDIDNDGDADLIAGGGGAMFVYESSQGGSQWTRHGSIDATNNIGANGAVIVDVDGDGDLDVISAKFSDDIGWWENPCGQSCSLSGTGQWAFHKIGEVGTNGFSGPHYYLHDIRQIDFGGASSGPQIAVPAISKTCGNIAIKWFEPGNDVKAPWTSYTISNDRSASSDGACNHAGIDFGDINADGVPDIAFSNGWYEAPQNPRTNWPSNSWHPVTNYDGISNTLIRDMDGDGAQDLVVAAGHVDANHDVRWYKNPGASGGSWSANVVGTLRSPECLQVEDLDNDTDLDIVSCDLDWSRWNQEVHNIYVFENLAAGTSWSRTNIAPNSYPSHLLQLTDVNDDNKVDIVSEATGYSVISYYENRSSVTSTAQDESQFELPAALSVDAVYPNPFSTSMEVSYFLPDAGHVRVSIHDASGRLIAQLADSEHSAGSHVATWNGRDDDGMAAAAGVYMIVVDGNKGKTSRTVVRVR